MSIFDFSSEDMITHEDLPKYDLFLSQVIEFLNDKFPDENYTGNIIQNYIKNEVISKPTDRKKRGYEKLHIVQLILLSYMRPILTTDEIKKVFSLAFNDINDRDDDILSWEETFKVFDKAQREAVEELSSTTLNEEKIEKMIEGFDLKEEDHERIKLFLTVMTLIAMSTAIKRSAAKLVKEFQA